VFGIGILGALLPTGTGGRTEARQFAANLHVALIAAAGVAVTGTILAATLVAAACDNHLGQDRTQPVDLQASRCCRAAEWPGGYPPCLARQDTSRLKTRGQGG